MNLTIFTCVSLPVKSSFPIFFPIIGDVCSHKVLSLLFYVKYFKYFYFMYYFRRKVSRLQKFYFKLNFLFSLLGFCFRFSFCQPFFEIFNTNIRIYFYIRCIIPFTNFLIANLP